VNGFLAVLIVLGLVTALAWLLRRGSLGALTGRGGAISVETAVASHSAACGPPGGGKGGRETIWADGAARCRPRKRSADVV